MKRKLFDFSAGLAVMTAAAYALLIGLAGFTYFFADGGVFFLVVFILLIVSFLFVFVYFVILAPRLCDDGVHQGAKFIAKNDIICRTAYDYRFKEGVILIKHRSLDYRELDEKMKLKQTVRIQATRSNLKKVSAYIGRTLETPKKPPRRKFFKRRPEYKDHKDKYEENERNNDRS